MDKRHQDALTDRLEDAAFNGCSHITWSELYSWYGVKKIAAGTYRDLETRWQDASDGKLGALYRIEGRGGIFVYGEKSGERITPDILKTF